MRRTNITKTIILIAILALMQSAICAQKAELVVQTGHTDFVKSVAFSPDAKMLASSGSDGTIKLWDVESGKQLKTFFGNFGSVYSVVFSPSGKVLAGGYDKNIKLWDIESGKQIKTLLEISAPVVFSSDGKTLLGISKDKKVALWDIESGRLLRTFFGDSSSSNSVTFSPDGKTLVSVNGDKAINLWNVENGNLLRTFSGHTGFVVSVAFSPDGKSLASGSWDGTSKLWDIESGNELRTFSEPSGHVESVAFSLDGKILVSARSNDNTIKLWDVQSGNLLRTFIGHSDFVNSVVFSPNGKTLASGSYDKTIKLWDVESGKQLKTFTGASDSVRAVVFSPDGKTLVGISKDNKIKLWKVERGKQLITLSEYSDSILSVIFSPDGKILVSVSRGKNIKLWDVESGDELRTFSGHSQILSFAFSPDGKTLASGGADRTIKLWNVENGNLLNTFSGPSYFNSVAFSLDGKTLESSSGDETIRLWDIESGRILKSLTWYDSQEVAKLFPELFAHYQRIGVSDKLIAERAENGKIKLFQKESNKEIATLIALNQNDWVVIDPAGRFDASPGAQEFMHFVVGLEPIDLEQIKDRYYTPNLLQRIFKGENLDATRQVSVFTADELYPLAEFSPLRNGQTKVDVKLTNRGGGIGRVQVFVNGVEFLADARPKVFDPKSKSGEFTIDFSAAKTLKKGESNDIKIIARNEAGWLRNRGAEIVYLDDRKKDNAPPEFYAIIGGVSEYENNAFNLQYSAKDARDFARATELGAIKLFGKDHVHIRLLASGAGEENAVLTGADSKQLAPTKENFKGTFAEFRKAKPTDVFVVYLAGHGTSINRGGDTGDTYLYLTQEAVTTDKSRLLDDKLRNATTVSSEELAEWIRDVPALKRAMILDTCAAGAVEASLTKARDLSPDQIKALDRMKDRTGFYVLMGSAADAQSYEATRYGQGLLTYSLLQGMSGASLQRGGEYADVSTLFNYAEDTVVEMAKGIGGIQQPRIIAPTESRSFDIGRFSTVEKGKFTLAKVKPLILQPKFFNSKESFDDLELSNSVEKALRDESSTVSRGDTEAKLVFVEANEMNDAVTPSGVYEVSGDQIKVTLKLIINKKPYKTVTVEGGAADKEELSRKIVAAIIANAPN